MLTGYSERAQTSRRLSFPCTDIEKHWQESWTERALAWYYRLLLHAVISSSAECYWVSLQMARE